MQCPTGVAAAPSIPAFMHRDFHVIRGDPADLLFLPRSYRVFRLAKEESAALLAWQTDKDAAPPSTPIGSLLADEAASGATCDPRPWGETDNLCLYVAQDCNLACTYCYNDRGRVANPGTMMAPDIADAAFRRFFTVPSRQYSVSMYGGEPLMNFDGIQAMVEAGARLEAERGIRISYSITTNGMLLNRRRIKFLRERFSSISVSVDGPKADHDRYRIAPKGSAYDHATKHLPALLDCCGDKVSLLGTLTGTAADRYRDALEHMRGLGTHRVSLSPVDGPDDNPAAMSIPQYRSYSRQHEALCVEAIENGLDGHAPREAINVVANMLTRRKLHRFCNAGCNTAIAADGSIYACHGLVGVPQFAMGNVADADNPAYARVRAVFSGLDVDLTQCSTCWARYLCGGQCYAQAHFRCGNVGVPEARYCAHVRRCLAAGIRSFVSVVEDAGKRARLYANARRLIGAGRGGAHG